MYDVVVVYQWPQSQNCAGCKHGEFIASETYDASCFRCKINYKGNNATCSKRQQGGTDWQD